MSRFVRTLLIGIGIGLLIAPMPGQEMRRHIGETWQRILNPPTENARIDQGATQAPSETARDLKQVAETAEDSSQARTMTGTTYEPAYPEYVNPETNQ